MIRKLNPNINLKYEILSYCFPFMYMCGGGFLQRLSYVVNFHFN